MTGDVQSRGNLELFSILWLDAAGSDSATIVAAQQRLRPSINHVRTFTHTPPCIQHIEAQPDDRFVVVASDRLGREIVSRVHYLRQVYSIYIYGLDRERSERWSMSYAKIEGVFTDFDVLVSQVRANHENRPRAKINEPLPITFFSTQAETNKEANGYFVYSQLLADHLLRAEFVLDGKDELIGICKKLYKGNDSELNIVREFEKDYAPDRAIWWFTRDAFASRLLNKALSAHNLDLLHVLQFFVRDIQQSIEKNRCAHSLCVYRAYLMTTGELEAFKSQTGEFLCVHEFFLANIYRQQTLERLSNTHGSNELQKVLFEIFADGQADPARPYCTVAPLSFFSGEDQLMFTLGSIFRLVKVHQQEDGIWIIRMKLTTDKHKQLKLHLQPLMDYYNTDPTNPLSFGRVLIKMSMFDEAEDFYGRLLKDFATDYTRLPECHYSLALANYEKGDYDSSLEWHHKAVSLRIQTMRSNDPALGYHYNSIANTYQKKRDYPRAMAYYNKALILLQRAFGDDHLAVAMCLNNMGCIYEIEKQYAKAIGCHQLALAIKTQHLPNDHLSVGATHNNLGTAYGCLGRLNTAMEHLHLALTIRLRSLPPRHPDIAVTLKNIGLVHEMKGNSAQAQVNYDKAVAIRRHTLPANHADVIRAEAALQRLSTKTT